jgi:hypothetical protein
MDYKVSWQVATAPQKEVLVAGEVGGNFRQLSQLL